MRRGRPTVAGQFPRDSAPGRAPVVHELYDRDRDRAEEEYVYEPLSAHDELPGEPRGEERGG
jgi:hypothetical protein